VNNEGQGQIIGQTDVFLEPMGLNIAGEPVAVEIEARLTHCGGLWKQRQAGQLFESLFGCFLEMVRVKTRG
jgi:hypothetical protein